MHAFYYSKFNWQRKSNVNRNQPPYEHIKKIRIVVVLLFSSLCIHGLYKRTLCKQIDYRIILYARRTNTDKSFIRWSSSTQSKEEEEEEKKKHIKERVTGRTFTMHSSSVSNNSHFTWLGQRGTWNATNKMHFKLLPTAISILSILSARLLIYVCNLHTCARTKTGIN